MPDISMCQNSLCTLKNTCHRFTATPNGHWQSYGSYSQDPQTQMCEDYWEDTPVVTYKIKRGNKKVILDFTGITNPK